jgi:hypothetical protein
VVAGCSQGLLPQEGHQVAKQVGGSMLMLLQCSNLLAAMLHLILDAFIVQRLEYFDYIYPLQEYGFEYNPPEPGHTKA